MTDWTAVWVAGFSAAVVAFQMWQTRSARKDARRDARQDAQEARANAEKDARAAVVALRREKEIAAVETFARLCTEHFSRQRLQVQLPKAARVAASREWGHLLEQAAFSQTFAFSAADALGLRDLQEAFVAMWDTLGDFDDLLNLDAIADEQVAPLVNRFGRRVGEIESRLRDLERDAG